ncbi:MAG: nucleotidyl transferase AbiEii/AbiGii toxin family protein [Polynucleobacter sp.]|uniref:nucleotidyl transferase AbiEii/AbiGii toxin family protein n=1 Tax=Polynucleobacter sp. TaxID=2029855 RepID=UPI0027264584|nr:nucleotidyl transferase AbiEii/AbiGii toxin family protein [Polynucleobacter sp.]MDO8714719.1 nucleotidyl transferase AbiEii/AbiGii toxin family protein [Polynucleobacter sp.]
MFKREHHQKISEVLQRLNAQVLKDHSCYFGGGTAIALMNDEYRESVDVDFLVSDLKGYRALRELLTGPEGILAITKSGRELVLAREIRTDQYGIRAMLRVGDINIKFEIISEGRIVFDVPKSKDCVGDIVTLSRIDLVASKLLANADRWNDDSVFSRDVIDLAMMKINKNEFHQAVEKASMAYGNGVLTSLDKAIDRLFTKEDLLERCITVMKISAPRAVLWQNLENLAAIRRTNKIGRV